MNSAELQHCLDAPRGHCEQQAADLARARASIAAHSSNRDEMVRAFADSETKWKARIAELERELAAMRRDRDGWKTAAEEAIEERAAQSKADAREIERCRAELAARPVVEGEAARRLREAWEKAPLDTREHVSNATWSYWGGMELVRAMRAFLESAPPASAASDDELRRQLSDSLDREARLRAQLEGAASDDVRDLRRWLCEIAERVGVKHSDTDALNVTHGKVMAAIDTLNERHAERFIQLAGYQDREMKAEEELAALKAAPPSEYVRAAVAFAEAIAEWWASAVLPYPHELRERFATLYDARKRGEQEKAGCAPASGSIMLNRPTHPTLDVAAPAPAPSERVTVYVLVGPGGFVHPSFYTYTDYCNSGPLKDGYYWLALDARVVAKGGAQ